MNNWMDIARVDTRRSYVSAVTWPYDKHPDLPQLTADAEITLLEADGPGVVTNLHASAYFCLDGLIETYSAGEKDAALRMMIEITYDHHDTPDISMPYYAFLGDPNGLAQRYATIYFGKVIDAHNFRLPIPFEKHIRITLKNPTKTDLLGYTDIQWKQLDSLPEDCGYLRVAYKNDCAMIPEEVITLADIQGQGTVKAHWLCLDSDFYKAQEGEYICEGNQEFYIDGETAPSLEYLGSEDAYAHSWGLGAASSDGYSALTGVAHPEEGRAAVTMLRCRTEDSIGFTKSMTLKMDYSQDYFAKDGVNPLLKKGVFGQRERATFRLDYQSCVYYYSAK